MTAGKPVSLGFSESPDGLMRGQPADVYATV
jgi:hypothetical protein